MRLKMGCIFVVLLTLFVFFAGVTQAEEGTKAVYRALVIGVEDYKQPLRGCAADAKRVGAMLQAANEGGAFYQAPVIRLNPTADQIATSFAGMPGWGADEDDVTFVFFSGAAMLDSKGESVGFVGSDNAVVNIQTVKAALDQVQGTKILVFNCVYPPVKLAKSVTMEDAVRQLNQTIYQMFGTGENQYLLTFASDAETADIVNSVSNQQFGIAIYFLSQACGYDYQNERPCDLLADANEDGGVSVMEAGDYVSQKINSFFSATGLKDLKVNMLVFPQEEEYPIIARRTSTQVSSIVLDYGVAEVAVEKAIRLSAVLNPPNATDRSVLWTCSDLAVASVDQQGNVRGLRSGDVVITATAANGLSETCTVKVRPIRRAESLTMEPETLIVVAGSKVRLKLVVQPEDVNEEIVWSSSTEDVAEVSQAGDVQTKEIGNVTITATTESGVTTQCEINVVAKGSIIETVEIKEHAVSLFQGDKKEMETKITPTNAIDRTITWASDDEEVATVSANGTITAVGQGTCVVSATAASGAFAECEVTVRGAVIELKTEQFNMIKGRSEQLVHRLIPADSKASIEWNSSNEEVATVDDTGKVTAVELGQTTITAQVVGGGRAQCGITVSEVRITSIQFKASSIKLALGEIRAADVRVKPDMASAQMLVWNTSDPQVVTIDEKGDMTGVSEGKAEITAMAEGGVTATLKVEVKPVAVTKVRVKPTSIALTANIEGSDMAQLEAQTTPENATERGVVWSSSDTSVVIVSDEGQIKALAEGKATIRATARNGKVYAECKVKVEANRVSYEKAQTGSARKLYISAKRIYYKDQSLFVELYFVNKTKEPQVVPKAGTLVLQWKDGREVELMRVDQGDKLLSAGKNNSLTYEIPLTIPGNDKFASIDLREAQATIRTLEEMAVQQQLAVPEATSDLGLIQRAGDEGDAQPDTPQDTLPEDVDESDFVDDFWDGDNTDAEGLNE